MQMKKRTKKYIVIVTLVVIVFSGVLFLNKSLENASASPKENSKVLSDREPLIIKENKEIDEKTESSSEEGTESHDEEKESENLEEIPLQEKIPQEESVQTEISKEETQKPEETAVEKETTSASPEEKNSENVIAESKQNTEQKTTKPTKSPIVVEKSRLGMTEYLLPFSNSEERVEATTHVVLHFSSNALNNPKDPYRIEDTYNIYKNYGISAHYVIGRAGEIYLFVSEDRVAYHAGKGKLAAFPEYNDQLNHYSIGIELLAMGTREEMIPIITAEKADLIDPALIGYTQAQYNALNTLLNDITARHPSIKRNRNHIVGHDEYSLYRKTDPGSLFNWSKIGL